MSTTTKTKRHRARKSSNQSNNKTHSKIISKKTRNTFKKNKHNTKCDNDFSDYYTSNDSTDYNQSSYYSTETETEYDSSHTSEYTSSDTEYDSSNSSHHKYIRNSKKKIRNQKRGTKRKISQHRDESSTDDDNSLHNRKMHKTHNKNNIIPALPSPPIPIPISIASLPKQIFNVIPMPIDTELTQQPQHQIETNMLNNINISLDMCMLGVPKLIETNDNNNNNNNHLDMNVLLSTMPPIDIGMIKKKRHDIIYNDNHRNNSIGISKRMRNHINSISFEYYTNMPKEWYNPMECIIGIETGRLLNNNQQRLNYVYNVVNELLTDTIINNNIIEDNNNNNNDEEYWKSLLDCLKADNDTLQHIHNKMISEMILRQKDERINTLKRYHKPLLNEQFNDLIMNHKQYNIHKQRLYEKSWINDKLTNKQIKNQLNYIKMLKKGPNPNQRNKERKYEVKKYYKYKKSEEKENKNMENENENELQTESENDIDEDKKRYDLDPNYNIKYEYIQDLNDIFDINKLTKGLPNGPQLMNIAKEYEQKYDDFDIGKRTLMGLPVNDTIYPLIMNDLINKYYENNIVDMNVNIDAMNVD